MKSLKIGTAIVAAILVAGIPGWAATATLPHGVGIPAQMVITARPAPGANAAATLDADQLAVEVNHRPAPVLNLERLTGDMANMQLFVLLDDSTRSSNLGVQLPALKGFLRSLPSTTQVAVGYMRNGTFQMAQAFTGDHAKAADSLRLPEGIPGENGSPYFALSELVKRWPSQDATGRRVVLMLTDGVDRYYDTAIVDDPYVDASIQDAVKQNVEVYSIYLRGAGLAGRGIWSTNVAQSRLMEVSQATGGFAYFQGLTNPVSVSPFLKDFENRLENQYRVTVEAPGKGVEDVKLQAELPGWKIEAPTRIYVHD